MTPWTSFVTKPLTLYIIEYFPISLLSLLVIETNWYIYSNKWIALPHAGSSSLLGFILLFSPVIYSNLLDGISMHEISPDL